MPELPEVEVLKYYFEEAALGKTIRAVGFHDKLNKIFKTDKQSLQNALTGTCFEQCTRIGKYLFAQTEKGPWLHFHFGMTGSLELFMNEAGMPRFTRFSLLFEDGSNLAFTDSRKFGVVKLVESPEAYRRQQGFGKDLLTITEEEFITPLQKRNIAIKTALLDQKHFAGIGNWIADEMLFETGVHPEKKASALDQEELKALFEKAVNICKEAIAKDTHYGDFPCHFFVHYRKEGALHPAHPKSPVERLVVGGRGTFIVPEKQKL